MRPTFGTFRICVLGHATLATNRSERIPRISDALFSYEARHVGNSDLVDNARWHFNRAIAVIGDKRINEITHKDIRNLIAAEMAREIKTRSIRKTLGYLSAGTWMCITERCLRIYNPFHRIRIPKEGFDKERREPVSPDVLAKIQAWCFVKDDDIRWLLAIISETGARASEIAGLAVEDLKTNISAPHLVIRTHPWRRLKTKYSSRLVPLVGIALWAAQRIVDTATPGQILAFPRYVRNGQLMKAVTSGINYWLAQRDFPYSVHAFRHCLVDRLREVACPPDIRRSILGWSPSGYEARYGYGYSTEILHRWMSRVWTDRYIEEAKQIHGTRPQRESIYGCMTDVYLTMLTLEASPTFKHITQACMLPIADIERGSREARKQGLVRVVQRPLSPKSGFHVLTGQPLPPPNSRERSATTLVRCAIIRKLYTPARPTRLQVADCFPSCFRVPEHSRLANIGLLCRRSI